MEFRPKPRGREDNGSAPLRLASKPVRGLMGLPLPIIKIGAASMLPSSLAITPEDLKDYVVYQVGALRAFAAAEGMPIQHVKPHGALYVMCTEDERYARAVVEALGELGEELILLLSGELVAAAARKAGVPFVAEGYIDLDYDAAGKLVIERVKRMREPAEVARRAVLLACEGRVPSPEGPVTLAAQSLCVHGDAPNAPAVAKAVREALLAAGVELVPLARLMRSREEGR